MPRHLEFRSSHESRHVANITNQSGLVENGGLALGIFLLSSTNPEIYCTSGFQVAILFFEVGLSATMSLMLPKSRPWSKMERLTPWSWFCITEYRNYWQYIVYHDASRHFEFRSRDDHRITSGIAPLNLLNPKT